MIVSPKKLIKTIKNGVFLGLYPVIIILFIDYYRDSSYLDNPRTSIIT